MDRATQTVIQFPRNVLSNDSLKGEAKLEKINLFDIYKLGAALGEVKKLDNDSKSGTAFLPLWVARDELKSLLDMKSIRIDFAKDEAGDALRRIEMAIREFGGLVENEITLDFNRTQVVKGLVWIKQTIDTFQTTFAAEMRKAASYVVPKRGSYDTSDLVDNAAAGSLSDEKAFLGSIALQEYKDAGRCFAFGLHTAAGFHACRAVESVMNSYLAWIGISAKELNELKTWGDLIKWLLELKVNSSIPEDQKPSEKTIDYLVSFLQPLKDHDRNLLMHVRNRYVEAEAEGMLSMTKAVMLLMASDMRKGGVRLHLVEDESEKIPF